MSSKRHFERYDKDSVEQTVSELSSMLHIDEQRVQMRQKIIDSLGEGFDDETLLAQDRKLCDMFLPPDSFYYDDGKHKKSSSLAVPTSRSEIETITNYKKSVDKRKIFLTKAMSFRTTSDFLAGNGRKNLQLYADLYNDIKNYHFAWFELIFKDKSTLHSVATTIQKYASLKMEDGSLEELEAIMALLTELNELFLQTVKENDKNACEDAGIIEYDYHELCYEMALKMAKANDEERAEHYFEEALRRETTWQYEDRRCTKLLEFATGASSLSLDDLDDMEEYNMEHEGLFFKCLKAKVEEKGGTVSWKSAPIEEECNKCGVCFRLEKKSKLRKCSRCKSVSYCSRECQKADWKKHKKLCR